MRVRIYRPAVMPGLCWITEQNSQCAAWCSAQPLHRPSRDCSFASSIWNCNALVLWAAFPCFGNAAIGEGENGLKRFLADMRCSLPVGNAVLAWVLSHLTPPFNKHSHLLGLPHFNAAHSKSLQRIASFSFVETFLEGLPDFLTDCTDARI